MYNIFDIAKFVLEYAHSKEISICHKKLQKLCYYVYGWNLYMFNEDSKNLNSRLFESNFEAWVHGPVSPELYHYISEHSEDVFDISSDDIKSFKLTSGISEALQNDIKETLEVYLQYSANELESISHQEEPWRKARVGCNQWDRCNKKIEDEDMFIEYSKRN